MICPNAPYRLPPCPPPRPLGALPSSTIGKIALVLGLGLLGAVVINAATGGKRKRPHRAGRRHRNRARTFMDSRGDILDELRRRGWRVVTVSPSMKPMKVPHATSPDGTLRLWFKPQAVYFTRGNYHDLGSARSLWIEDIRRMTPEQFVSEVEGSSIARAANWRRRRNGRVRFCVAAPQDVIVGPRGSSATLRSDAQVPFEYSSFDEAYDAAAAAGGDRWVISTVGSSEYVPKDE